MPRRQSVAIIEDDPSMLQYLISVVDLESDYTLIGTASSVQESQKLLQKKPDIVLTDLGLPDGDGLEIVKNATHDSKFVVMSVRSDKNSVLSAIKAGAKGYIIKYDPPGHILDVLRSVQNGGSPLSDQASRHLVTHLADNHRTTTQNSQVKFSLTDRECTLLTIFSEGHTYREAAKKMHISEHTVSDYVKKIYRKLDAKSRSEAVYKAIKHDLIRITNTAH
ncbi:MAG: response regulator [bacterium]